MPDIKVGDHYRVILEGPWEGDTPTTTEEIASLLRHDDYLITESDKVKVEKIEPPVEVFKPGDLVRDKEEGWVFAIGEGGYLRTDDRYGARAFQQSGHVFTSKNYEKVELS